MYVCVYMYMCIICIADISCWNCKRPFLKHPNLVHINHFLIWKRSIASLSLTHTHTHTGIFRINFLDYGWEVTQRTNACSILINLQTRLVVSEQSGDPRKTLFLFLLSVILLQRVTKVDTDQDRCRRVIESNASSCFDYRTI